MQTQKVPEKDIYNSVDLRMVPAIVEWTLTKRKNNGGAPVYVFSIYQTIGPEDLDTDGHGQTPNDAIADCIGKYLNRWAI